MRRIAVFMGAGASKGFGYPLTNELLPLILRKNEARADPGDPLGDGIRRLLPGLDARKKAPLITEVLSLIDYSIATSTTPLHGYELSKLVELRLALERAIFEVLNENWGSEPEPSALRTDFVRWLEELGAADDVSLGVISTNYDIAVEQALYDKLGGHTRRIAEAFDFGFAWREPNLSGGDVLYPRPLEPEYRWLKLHGSLNWLRCDACEHIFINPGGIIAHQAARSDRDHLNTCWCSHGRLRMVLVAPSMVRDVRELNLLQTWQAALEWLRIADEWVIIGYSFPPEDLAIQSMFIRARNAARWESGSSVTRQLRVQVVQCGDDARDRYELLFPDCEYESGGLKAFMKGRRARE